MKRFRKILFYTDGKEGDAAALGRAVDLAQRNQGQLTVAYVLEELPRDLSRLAAGMPLKELQDIAMSEAGERLQRLAAPFQAKGASVSIEVLCGRPFMEIIRAVLRGGHDVVMMVAEGRGAVRGALFGSTSQHLMRKCPCPVWVLKPSQPRQFTRILAAVDPDPTDVVRDGVNRKVMELAASLASLEASELHVVHAWQPHDPSAWRGWRARVPEAQVRDWAEQTRAERRRRLDELLGKFNLKDVSHRLHLIEGDAGRAISQVAAEEKIDLLVMGTLARIGLEGYFIGNTAETVLQEVACSVLSVKPDGFVSPVKPDSVS